MIRRAAVAVLVLVSACSFMPTEPGVEEFTLDGQLRADLVPIWKSVEKCSGKARSIDEIRWFRVPGALDFEHKGKVVVGYYRPPDQIVMGEEGYYFDSWVAHEMLHAILREPGHPHEFLVECASIVSPP